jgi:hypothetical protein
MGKGGRLQWTGEGENWIQGGPRKRIGITISFRMPFAPIQTCVYFQVASKHSTFHIVLPRSITPQTLKSRLRSHDSVGSLCMTTRGIEHHSSGRI